MSKGEQSKIVAGRWLGMLAMVALEGAAEGAIGAGAGIPTPNTLFPLPPLPGGLANEWLAARPDGQFVYALDIDIHKVSVIDVATAAVLRRIPVDNSVTTIQVAPDGRHLLCAGTGFMQTVDLELSKMAN